MTKLTLASVLTFGKHPGKTIDWVCKNDPSYILWIDENSREYVVSNTAYKAALDQQEEDMMPDYYDAMGDNW